MALKIEHLNQRFEGEFTFKGKTHGIPFTLPGDMVSFRLMRKGRKGPRIKVEEIERAPHHGPWEEELTEPFCSHFAVCGGCRGQHLRYESQLRIKLEPDQKEMERLFGIKPEIRPAPHLQRYRNRMDFVVEGESVGLRGAGDFRAFVDLEGCPIQRENADRALSLVRSLLHNHSSLPLRRQEGTGILKYVTIREGAGSGVVILTRDSVEVTPGGEELYTEYETFLAELGSGLEEARATGTLSLPFSLVDTVAPSRQAELSVLPGGKVVQGESSFRERLGEREFLVPYDSFFQPNPVAFDEIIAWSLQRLEREKERLTGSLLDLYSGAGILSSLFTARLSHSFQGVYGYDFIVSSVEEAPAHFSHFSGELHFQAVDLNKPAPGTLFPPDLSLIIADPPRAGLSPALVRLLREESVAPLFLYISCNPETQRRDLQSLQDLYRPVEALLVDTFPHTPHRESAVLLVRDPRPLSPGPPAPLKAPLV